MAIKRVKAIMFDLGDTLRIIRDDEEYRYRARSKIAELLGTDMEADEFYKTVIEPRYDKYREWALTYYCEAPEKVLWTRWLAYDFPKDRVEAAAGELTYQYRQSKGERVVVEGGIDTIKELKARGYKLAIVSDLVGVKEVEEWLDRDQIRGYFDSVQQSSICYIRKPHPAIYYYALNDLGVDAEDACFVGDNLDRDIVGAKAAGLGMTVGVAYPTAKTKGVTEANKPDAFVKHFPELLDLFPPLD